MGRMIGSCNSWITWCLPNVYRHADGLVHTSSDGQKFKSPLILSMPATRLSIFGHDQGVSAYTFIDMRHFLPYSLIISAAEHEAHYVIDGLMHNEVVKSDIHSTDTGGYSEILGAMHLLGFVFMPHREFREVSALCVPEAQRV